jgi:hypothetical protein
MQRAVLRSSALLKVAFVLAILIQFIRPPEPVGELPADGTLMELHEVPEPVATVLRDACYDCHSGDTRWPWYARVAPISWLIVNDVRHGRSNLDFSRWSLDRDREPTLFQRLTWICRDVRRDIMPPRLYTLMHQDARLDDAEKELLCAWTETTIDALGRSRGAWPGSGVTRRPVSPDVSAATATHTLTR